MSIDYYRYLQSLISYYFANELNAKGNSIISRVNTKVLIYKMSFFKILLFLNLIILFILIEMKVSFNLIIKDELT